MRTKVYLWKANAQFYGLGESRKNLPKTLVTLAVFFFPNTPWDSNPRGILYLWPLTKDVKGTCIMWCEEITLCVW